MTKTAEVRQLWEEGYTKAEIARKMQMHHQNVSRIIKEYELEKEIKALKK